MDDHSAVSLCCPLCSCGVAVAGAKDTRPAGRAVRWLREHLESKHKEQWLEVEAVVASLDRCWRQLAEPAPSVGSSARPLT